MQMLAHVWERMIEPIATFFITIGLVHSLPPPQPVAVSTPSHIVATTTSEIKSAEEVTPTSTTAKKETRSAVDPDPTGAFKILRETNTISFTTEDWEFFTPVSYVSDIGFTLNFPKEWVYTGDGFNLNGERIAVRPPGITVLHKGQSCLDNFPTAPENPESDSGRMTFLNQQAITYNGREMLWAQAQNDWSKDIFNTYCIQEDDKAFSISFFSASTSQNVMRDIVSSVHIFTEHS